MAAMSKVETTYLKNSELLNGTADTIEANYIKENGLAIPKMMGLGTVLLL